MLTLQNMYVLVRIGLYSWRDPIKDYMPDNFESKYAETIFQIMYFIEILRFIICFK